MTNVNLDGFNQKLAKRVLLCSVLAVGFGQTILFAVLGPLGREIGLVEMQIGAIISASSLTVFLASPFWGRTSDVWGRRKVILIGLFGYTLGTIVFTSVFKIALLGWLLPMGAFIALTVARVANAAVMAATMPAANAYMADITDAATRTKAMGSIGAASNIGAILGPAIGGLLASFTLLTPIWFSAGLTLVAAIVVLFTLPEIPGQKSTVKPPRMKYTDQRILPFVIVGIVMFMGFAIVQQTIAFRFQDLLSLSAAETAKLVGIGMMLSAAASVFAQMVVIPLLDVRPFTLLKIAMPLLIVAFAMMAMSSTQLMLTISMTIQGLGMGLASPGFMAGASLAVTAKEQGAVAGVAGSCPPMGFTIGPLVGTALYTWNPDAPYWFTFGAYILLFIFTMTAKIGRKVVV
ncbi:MAG: MFS family permease [Gammaproteobacteria bacterium]|jgi:MFS family permease